MKNRGAVTKMAPGAGGWVESKNNGHRNAPAAAAAAAAEDNFKLCGLCSQLVDESVQVNDKLRAFLIRFLSVANAELPAKVCTDCYSHALESMKFKDRCEKAMNKLKNNKVSESMVLGRSTEDKKQVKAMDAQMPDPLVAKGQAHILEDFEIPRFPMRDDLKPLGPRAHRAAKYPDRLPQPRTCIILSHSEKSVAEKALSTPYWSISYKVRGSLVTPQRPAKRVAGTPASSSVKAAKKARVADPLAAAEPSTPSAPPPEVSVSSFGRVRKPKKYNFDDDDDDIFGDQLDDDEYVPPAPDPEPEMAKPLAVPNAEPKRSAGRPKKNEQAKATEKKESPSKGAYYYVGQEGNDETQKLVEVSKEDEEDDEEIFPSIGPYQCEICQNITNTKQEFVDHIKKFHRNVVDESVLVSLENDLKKSKLKKAREEAAAAKVKQGGAANGPGRARMAGPKSRTRVPATERTDLVEPVEKRTCPHCDLVLTYSKDMNRHNRTATCIKKRREKENKARKAQGLPPLENDSNGGLPGGLSITPVENTTPRAKHQRSAKANAKPIIDAADDDLLEEPKPPAQPQAGADAGPPRVPTAAARKSMDPLPNATQTTDHYNPKKKVVEQYEKESKSEKIITPTKLKTPKKPTSEAPRQATPSSTVVTPVKRTTIVRETPTTIVTSDSYFDGGVDFEEPEETGLGGGIMLSHDPVKRAVQEAAIDRSPPYTPYQPPQQQHQPVVTRVGYPPNSSVWLDSNLGQNSVVPHHQQQHQQQQQPMAHHAVHPGQAATTTLDFSSLNPSITNSPINSYTLGGVNVVVNEQPQHQVLMPEHLSVLNTPHHSSFY